MFKLCATCVLEGLAVRQQALANGTPAMAHAWIDPIKMADGSITVKCPFSGLRFRPPAEHLGRVGNRVVINAHYGRRISAVAMAQPTLPEGVNAAQKFVFALLDSAARN